MSCYDLPFCLVRLFGTHFLGSSCFESSHRYEAGCTPSQRCIPKTSQNLARCNFSEEILFFTRYVSMKGFVFLLQIYRFIAEIICNQKVIR